MNTRAIGSILNRARRCRQGRSGRLVAAIALGVGLSLGGCQGAPVPPPRQIRIHQAWELQPGQMVAGFRVAASLGDISIDMAGASVKAPFIGEVEPAALAPDCVFFSSPEVPAYLFRYCGLRHPHLGPIQPGEAMGSAKILHFATLRRQPDGTWAMVEPSSNVLERSLLPVR
ncbi:MAG: hypothetical protein VKJ09_13445 [Leptolyngbya sp.]|nr:hypothetical protein [Leptolyngbya sp.]